MIDALFGVWLAFLFAGFGWLWCLRLLWVDAEYEHDIWKLAMRAVDGVDARCRDHHLTGRSMWQWPRESKPEDFG